MQQEGFATARVITTILEAIGWLAVAAGVFILMLALTSGGQRELWASLALGCGTSAGGILMVASAQIVKAQIITAVSTRETARLLQQLVSAPEAGPAPTNRRQSPEGRKSAGQDHNQVGSSIKRYKGKVIIREADGVSVENLGHYANVLEAERAIDKGLTG